MSQAEAFWAWRPEWEPAAEDGARNLPGMRATAPRPPSGVHYRARPATGDLPGGGLLGGSADPACVRVSRNRGHPARER